MKKRMISFALAAALMLTPAMGTFAMDLPLPAVETEEALTVEEGKALTDEAAEADPYAGPSPPWYRGMAHCLSAM